MRRGRRAGPCDKQLGAVVVERSERQHDLTVDAPRTWERPVVCVPVLVALSLVGGRFSSFSTEANVYVFGAGGVLIWLGLTKRVQARPAPERLPPGAVWWALPVAAVIMVFLRHAVHHYRKSDLYGSE